MSEEKKRSKWHPVGYLSKSRTGAHAVIMIGGSDGSKNYYICDIHEALEVLTGRMGFAKILKKEE